MKTKSLAKCSIHRPQCLPSKMMASSQKEGTEKSISIGWKHGVENNASYYARAHYFFLFLLLPTNFNTWEKT